MNGCYKNEMGGCQLGSKTAVVEHSSHWIQLFDAMGKRRKWCVLIFECAVGFDEWFLLCNLCLQSGAKINISDGSCPERIVTVTGPTNAIFKAFTLICKKFEEVRLTLLYVIFFPLCFLLFFFATPVFWLDESDVLHLQL